MTRLDYNFSAIQDWWGSAGVSRALFRNGKENPQRGKWSWVACNFTLFFNNPITSLVATAPHSLWCMVNAQCIMLEWKNLKGIHFIFFCSYTINLTTAQSLYYFNIFFFFSYANFHKAVVRIIFSPKSL